MMLLWALAGIPLGVYNIISNFNVALRIQPQILAFLSLVTWGQCMYYGHHWQPGKVLTATTSLGLSMGGLEVGLIFALRRAEQNNAQWAVTLMAVLSALLLSAGVARHYWDIWKMKTVRGISFIFVFIDALGDLTSLISILFEPKLDILGLVIYGSELLLWTGVFACGGYYNFRPWVRRMIKQHRESREDHISEAGSEQGGVGRSTAFSLERRSSSSSITVFRTASQDPQDERLAAAEERQ